MTNFQEYIGALFEYLGNSPDTSRRLIISAAIILVLWVLRLIAIRIVNRRFEEISTQYKWRKNLTYTAVVLGIFLVGRLWFEGLQSIATFLGLLSAGLAIALREPVADLAGWIFIIWRKPFGLGDRIQIGEVKGDVIDLRIFKFTVLEIGNWVHADQSTGRVIHVSNHKIFSESVANYTSDFEFIWHEIPVVLTFESDWKKAKKLLQEISERHLEGTRKKAEHQIRRASRSYLIHYKYLTPIVYTEAKDHGICLTVRHLTDPRRRRSLTQKIWEDVLDGIADDPDIHLAYPTMRIYRQGEERPTHRGPNLP
jgi:small-conductance mechanosensitive channel